jgi:hypothetical protein
MSDPLSPIILNGSSGLTSDLEWLLQPATLGGDSGLTSDLEWLLQPTTLDGDSALSPLDLEALYSAGATLLGDSGLSSLATAHYATGSSLSGSSTLSVSLSWFRPSPPNRMPSSNTAATLQQFIDALGVGRSVAKTPTANSTVVDPNPPRKPFTPR